MGRKKKVARTQEVLFWKRAFPQSPSVPSVAVEERRKRQTKTTPGKGKKEHRSILVFCQIWLHRNPKFSIPPPLVRPSIPPESPLSPPPRPTDPPPVSFFSLTKLPLPSSFGPSPGSLPSSNKKSTVDHGTEPPARWKLPGPSRRAVEAGRTRLRPRLPSLSNALAFFEWKCVCLCWLLFIVGKVSTVLPLPPVGCPFPVVIYPSAPVCILLSSPSDPHLPSPLSPLSLPLHFQPSLPPSSIMSGRNKVKKPMTLPINLIFKLLQDQKRVTIWLYEDTKTRLEGQIIGFDEYMNVTLDNAAEVDVKTGGKEELGRLLLKGDTITLIQECR